MSTKYQNKYRISSARLQTWDYGNVASYFVTICTQQREHFFGEIADNKMQLNDIGKLVEHEWIKTPELRPDMNLQLGQFVVMPNHFHAVIIIGENIYNSDTRRDAMHGVSTLTHDNTLTHNNTLTHDNTLTPHNKFSPHETLTHIDTPTPINQFGPQTKNLASIIRGFKSSVTTGAKKMGHSNFAWQPRFHDHIIRDSVAFENIQNYIVNNPSNWKEDKFNLV